MKTNPMKESYRQLKEAVDNIGETIDGFIDENKIANATQIRKAMQSVKMLGQSIRNQVQDQKMEMYGQRKKDKAEKKTAREKAQAEARKNSKAEPIAKREGKPAEAKPAEATAPATEKAATEKATEKA